MAGKGTALRTGERAVSGRGGLPVYLSRRSAIELVVLDVLIASVAVIAVLPSSIEVDARNVIAVMALLPGVSALTSAAVSAASVPDGLSLAQLDPGADPGSDATLERARRLTAGGLGLLSLGSVAAAVALVV